MKTRGDTIQLIAGGTVLVTSDPGELISLVREPLTYSGGSTLGYTHALRRRK